MLLLGFNLLLLLYYLIPGTNGKYFDSYRLFTIIIF